jgi:Tol biopolymer transport system component
MRTIDFIPQRLEIDGDIEYISFWGNDTLLYSKRIKADGKSVIQIFKYSLKDKKEERVLASQFNDVNAVISPDGKRIAFLSDRKVDYNLYLYDFDKKVVEQMDIKDGIKGGSLSWSKDGSYVAYVVLSGSAKYNVKLVNAEKRTVWDLGEGYNVCFSPDGKYVCYATYDIKNRKQVIYKMNLKEQKEEKIYEFPEQSVYSRSINMLCWIDG